MSPSQGHTSARGSRRAGTRCLRGLIARGKQRSLHTQGWMALSGCKSRLGCTPRCGCTPRYALREAMSFSHCCPLLEKKTTPLRQMMPAGLQRGRAHRRRPSFPVLSPVTPRDSVQPWSAILAAPCCPPAPPRLPTARVRVRGQEGGKER